MPLPPVDPFANEVAHHIRHDRSHESRHKVHSAHPPSAGRSGNVSYYTTFPQPRQIISKFPLDTTPLCGIIIVRQPQAKQRYVPCIAPPSLCRGWRGPPPEVVSFRGRPVMFCYVTLCYSLFPTPQPNPAKTHRFLEKFHRFPHIMSKI